MASRRKITKQKRRNKEVKLLVAKMRRQGCKVNRKIIASLRTE